MSKNIRLKKSYVLFPKVKKPISSPEPKMTSKKKARLFLQELNPFFYYISISISGISYSYEVILIFNLMDYHYTCYEVVCLKLTDLL